MSIKIKTENKSDFEIVQLQVFKKGGTWSDYSTEIFPFEKVEAYGLLLDVDENTGKIAMSFFENINDFEEDEAKELDVDEFLCLDEDELNYIMNY